jgi:suppressor of ftsI
MSMPGTSRPRRRARRVLGRVLVVLLALAGLSAGLLGFAWTTAAVDTADEVDFTNRLPVPPLADWTVDDAGRRVFDLRLQAGRTDFGRGGPGADTWGVSGEYLGPTLRAERGEQVAVRVTNDLGETTTLHWHGMHLPAAMDGGPHQMIAPGDTWEPHWRIDQPAATLWYHPHLHGETAQHVYRGLAGLFLIDDPDTPASLPDEYGVDDLPVIVQDKSFSDDGQLDADEPLFSPTGFLGETVVVNGSVRPYAEVKTERVRLRLLNGSNARIYNFGLVGPDGDERGMHLVGTDGGLLPAPAEIHRVMLSPGERAEVVVTMTPGENVTLRSFPADLGADFWNERFSGGDDTFDVLELRGTDHLDPSPPLLDRLAPAPDLRAEDATVRRSFRLGGTNINGRDMDMDRIDQVVHVGDTEIWELRNAAGSPHNFHVHGVQFQVVDVDGAPPPRQLSGWKDTVYVAPDSTVRLVMRFDAYPDPNSPFMFHCHLLRHEDQGMMGQFLVVGRGDDVQPGDALDNHGDHQ